MRQINMFVLLVGVSTSAPVGTHATANSIPGLGRSQGIVPAAALRSTGVLTAFASGGGRCISKSMELSGEEGVRPDGATGVDACTHVTYADPKPVTGNGHFSTALVQVVGLPESRPSEGGQTSPPATATAAAYAVEFEVPMGATVGGFTCARDGRLVYRGKPFSPAVAADATSLRGFKISLLKSKGFAGAIAIDSDGKNTGFLLDMTTLSATAMERPGTVSAAQRVFWSPSQKYVVVLCAYEGERFISIDLTTKRLLDGNLMGHDGKMWHVSDEPRWIPDTDVLVFGVNEHCNPYQDRACTDQRMNVVLGRLEVRLDASTLRLTPKRREPR